ncbi:MAG: hypothetical protein EA427_13300 [Spirochaetaceae bacterium]|nr:MAG: hypothetical protein EA427_13300 [Spirochaetaceae bacterium]
MRRNEHYTVPFPPAELPAPIVYRERFREFPVWYRWYLRLLAVIRGITIEEITRLQDLQELRRKLTSESPDVVDCATPLLLPGFHNKLRILESQRRRSSSALQEITRNSRGRFLVHALAGTDPETYRALEEASRVPETLLESTSTTLAVAQEAVRVHLTAELDVQIPIIERRLSQIWTSLWALNLLRAIDLSPLFPRGDGAVGPGIPLRVVRAPLLELYQLLDLVQANACPPATDLAWDFARQVARMNPGPPGAIWNALDDFVRDVPLQDLVRLAWDEPHLETRPLSIRAEWWEPFRQAWLTAGVDATAGELFAQRTGQVREILSRVYMIDRAPAPWLPGELYPATLGFVLLLAGSEYFHDSRRVVTQLVIDGVFHHLDTRNALHQAALQIDQALERLTALLGDGESRGTLGEELQRIRQRSTSSAIVRRRLVELYERHRRRIRGSLEELIGALETGGTLVGQTLSGKEVAFEYQRLKTRSFSGDFKARDLLQTVGESWLPLGQRLRALYRIESGA